MKEMTIKVWPVEKLIPYERNVKKHPPEQIKSLVASIERFGWDQPIVVDKEGVIIKGHGRRLAAIEMGLKKVPVLVRDDLDEIQVKQARLADNRAAMSGYDTAMLRLELQSLGPQIKGLEDVYTEKELTIVGSDFDFGEQNLDAFVGDVDLAVSEQEQEARKKADESAARSVTLAKAFGFNEIKGADEIYITRFMAMVEAESGLTGAEALIAFLKKLAE